MSVIRTFIAIGVEGHAADCVWKLKKELSAVDNRVVRWVALENYHVNLAFLGDVADAKLAEVCRIAASVSLQVEPFTWRLSGLGAFPNTRRANVIWVGVREEKGTLAGLHDALKTDLIEIGYTPERRPFRPHVTLGRVARGKRLPMEATERIETGANWAGAEVETSEIVVVGSELSRGGARYSVLARCPLAKNCTSREV